MVNHAGACKGMGKEKKQKYHAQILRSLSSCKLLSWHPLYSTALHYSVCGLVLLLCSLTDCLTHLVCDPCCLGFQICSMNMTCVCPPGWTGDNCDEPGEFLKLFVLFT